MEPMVNDERTRSAKNVTAIIYALYAASLVVGISSIVAIVMNYVKRDEMRGTLFESHFRWQIRTFWFGLLWGVLGALSLAFVVGLPVLLANVVWIIYRIVKGWLNLNDNKPMYAT